MEKTATLKIRETEITFCNWGGTTQIEMEICHNGEVNYSFIDRKNVMEFIKELNKWGKNL